MVWVVGFLFNTARDTVVLIEKSRPKWQAGLMNGPGGHVESGETPLAAMRREFQEEAGPDVEAWEQFAIIHVPGGQVHFFKAFNDVALDAVMTRTDERIAAIFLEELDNWDLVANLHYLIPLALHIDTPGSGRLVLPVILTEAVNL